MNFSEVTRFTAGETKIAQLKDTDGTVLWTDPQFTRADGTSPAYQHTMVSGTQKYAEVDEVGGKSVVWNQLCNTAQSSTNNGVTFTNNGDGSWTVNGTATADASSNLLFKFEGGRTASKYLLTGCPVNGSRGTYYLGGFYFIIPDNSKADVGNCCIINDNNNLVYADYIKIIIRTGTTVNNLVFRPRLINITQAFGSGSEPSSITDPRILAIKKYALEHPAYDTGSVLHFGCNEIVSTDSDNQQIDSLPIPAEVRALEGYGWGIGSVNNKVDFPQKIYRKSIGKYTFTGNENFRYMSVYGFFTQIFTSTIKKPLTEYVVANILMANKTTKSFYDVFAGGNNTDYIGVNINGYVAFSSNLTEVDDFKSYITGKTIYYELATPVETDISQYLDNNLLEVEAGGTVTLKQPNDTEMPLPNSIKYLVKGV